MVAGNRQTTVVDGPLLAPSLVVAAYLATELSSSTTGSECRLHTDTTILCMEVEQIPGADGLVGLEAQSYVQSLKG